MGFFDLFNKKPKTKTKFFDKGRMVIIIGLLDKLDDIDLKTFKDMFDKLIHKRKLDIIESV